MTKSFANPVFPENFPDPCVLKVGDSWYAYGTNGPRGNIPLLVSPDLVTWSPRGDTFPRVGQWAKEGYTWAPDVVRADSGDYVMYYTARSRRHDCQAIGVAIAKSPDGPFVDSSSAPLLCEADEGGSIDASAFRDIDGNLYLYWKNDGNAIGQETRIYARALSRDGLSLTGARTTLLVNDAKWHGHVIEAPQMLRRATPAQPSTDSGAGGYILFYSANAYDSAAYAMGYAICDGPLGPCRDGGRNPILISSADAAGPGHGCAFDTGDGQSWLLYHAWPPSSIGSETPGRQLWLDRIDWIDDEPVVRGPNAKAQPVPLS